MEVREREREGERGRRREREGERGREREREGERGRPLLISELMKGNYIDHTGMSKQFSLQKNKMKF